MKAYVVRAHWYHLGVYAVGTNQNRIDSNEYPQHMFSLHEHLRVHKADCMTVCQSFLFYFIDFFFKQEC